jgi:hypothetical protein
VELVTTVTLHLNAEATRRKFRAVVVLPKLRIGSGLQPDGTRHHLGRLDIGHPHTAGHLERHIGRPRIAKEFMPERDLRGEHHRPRVGEELRPRSHRREQLGGQRGPIKLATVQQVTREVYMRAELARTL